MEILRLFFQQDWDFSMQFGELLGGFRAPARGRGSGRLLTSQSSQDVLLKGSKMRAGKQKGTLAAR